MTTDSDGDVTFFPRRTLDVNSMADLAGFVQRWDDDSPGRGPASFDLRTSDYGNIGDRSEPGAYAAPDLCPKDAQWSAAVEPGVRPLVEALITGWHVITYSSCQGHRYPDLDLPAVPLEVGLLPRSRAEHARLSERLRALLGPAVCEDGPVRPLTGSARLRVWSNVLDCETTGRGHSVLDLVVEKVPERPWSQYFAERDEAVGALVAEIGAGE